MQLLASAVWPEKLQCFSQPTNLFTLRNVFSFWHCTFCSAGTLGDEQHLVFVCASLAALRAKYADLFTATTTTMRLFFAQSDHLRVFHYVIDCLNMMNA